MCGIGGIFTVQKEASSAQVRADVRAMTQLVARRGPDDEGFWQHDHCALGFRRLSILDLSEAGHQPMVSACGNYVIMLNGEVYNFPELRRTLESEGVRFRSRADSEVVLEALVHWGEAALPKFNGMFALAFYDIPRNSLLLARDPLGIKPLYYLVHPKGLVFGSQFNQITQHPWCDQTRINTKVLGLYLRLGYVPPPYGMFENTYQLKPGYWLRATPEQEPHIKSFYHFSNESTQPSLRGTEAVEAVADAAKNAVKRQMVSDVPIGVFLSGGVDSPLVAALMQQSSPGPLPAITIGSTDPRLDESLAARLYAEHFGMDHTIRVFSSDDAIKYLDEFAEAYSEPFADDSAFPSLMVSRLARERMTVALSGDGGDEIFLGYPRFNKVLNASPWFRYPSLVRMAVYGAARLSGRSSPPRGILAGSIGEWYRDGHSGLHTTDLNDICPGLTSVPDDFESYTMNSVPDRGSLALWMRQAEIDAHLPMMLMKMDRASMHYGLEVRVPLLDLELLKVAARIPPAECLNNGVGKLPLRKTLEKFIPGERIPKRKAGFDIPMAEWLRGPLRPHVEELLLNRDPYPNGFFDRRALQTLYDSHLKGGDRSRGLWTLLALQIWADKHLKRTFSNSTRDLSGVNEPLSLAT